jgi:hypothetical protein
VERLSISLQASSKAFFTVASLMTSSGLGKEPDCCGEDNGDEPPP